MHQQRDVYLRGPRRELCKICENHIDASQAFVSHQVKYFICKHCGHVNGEREETDEFLNFMYSEDLGKSYAKEYISDSFVNRCENIYKPKLDFLASVIPFKKRQLSILDVGCGSGGLTYSAIEMGFDCEGIDVNHSMVNYGNNLMLRDFGRSALRHLKTDEIFQEVENSNSDIVMAIGVLEHIRSPKLLLDAFRKSNSSYLFYLVPMFSLSVILEGAFQDKFPRVLSGGHTHIFTESSVEFMNSEQSLDVVGEWRIGLDFWDLFSILKLELAKTNEKALLGELLEEKFLPQIDSLQGIMDKAHFCSELHAVVKKRG